MRHHSPQQILPACDHGVDLKFIMGHLGGCFYLQRADQAGPGRDLPLEARRKRPSRLKVENWDELAQGLHSKGIFHLYFGH